MSLLGKVWSCSYIHKTFELESLEENDIWFTTEKVVADDVENFCESSCAEGVANPNENMKAKPKTSKYRKRKKKGARKLAK